LVDDITMPDLWKALGDVYGDADTDAPPVTVEPAADQRALPLDDDLAAALSAALVNAPAAPANVVGPAPLPPIAPPPAPSPLEAQEKVASWLAEIKTRQELREKGPDLDAALPEGVTWCRTDDDIIPARKGGRRR
jgi:hypothetical protein